MYPLPRHTYWPSLVQRPRKLWKVGQWTRAEGEGACPSAPFGGASPFPSLLPSYQSPGVLPPENFWKYRRKSVQFCAFLATSATENVQLRVFNLDFGRSIRWHHVIKRGTENRRFTVPGIYRPRRIGSAAPGLAASLTESWQTPSLSNGQYATWAWRQTCQSHS